MLAFLWEGSPCVDAVDADRDAVVQEAVVPAAAPVPAVAPVAPPLDDQALPAGDGDVPPRAHRVLRGRGVANRNRIAGPKLRAHDAENALLQLDVSINPSVQTQVSRVFGFGYDGGGTEQRAVAQSLKHKPGWDVVTEKRRARARRRALALRIHCREVRARLPGFISGADLAVCSAMSDDATMWSRGVPDSTTTALQQRRFGRRVQRTRGLGASCRQKKRRQFTKTDAGRNVASTVLNVVQHMLVKNRRERQPRLLYAL